MRIAALSITLFTAGVFAIACSTAVQAGPLWQQVDVLRNGEDGLTSLAGVYDLVFSPDGQYAYSAAHQSSAVTVFARDNATGALSPIQVIENNVGGVTGIGATRALRLSPDGTHMYVAGTSDSAVAVFNRDAATGQLTFNTSHTFAGGMPGLLIPNAMNISNDGRFVHVSSEYNDSLATYARDASTGALTFVQMLKDGVGPIDSLDTIRSFTITADNQFLYAPARDDGRVTQFFRDPVTGELSPGQVLTTAPNASGPTHITFSPDGRHAYVSAQFSDSLSLYNVDPTTGELAHHATYNTANGYTRLDHAEDIVVTADGEFVVVTATIEGAMTVLRRDPLTGELTIFKEFRDGVDGIDGLYRARELILSPDERFLYVMSPEEHTIAIFSVPEPSSAVLAILGMLGIFIAARGRSKRRA